MTQRIITRRQFLKTSASATIAGALLLDSRGSVFGFGEGDARSRVVLVRDENALDDLGGAREAVMQDMLDRAVTALTGESDALAAWRTLVGPKDVVGIKSNAWGYLPTPEAVEKAIKLRVIEAGVAEENIAITDQEARTHPTFKRATALINTRPLRTHAWSGVGSLIKNYIMFVERPSAYHGDSCADLATIWKLPHVAGKTRLNVLVMLTPLFHGVGPHHFSSEFVWKYRGLLVGFDPVAVDATGVRILVAKRREHFGEDRPLNPPAKHIQLADTRHHLGSADPEKIELIALGWKEGVLI